MSKYITDAYKAYLKKCAKDKQTADYGGLPVMSHQAAKNAKDIVFVKKDKSMPISIYSNGFLAKVKGLPLYCFRKAIWNRRNDIPLLKRLFGGDFDYLDKLTEVSYEDACRMMDEYDKNNI